MVASSALQLITGISGTALKIQGARMDAKVAELEANYAANANEFNATVALQSAQLTEESALLERYRAEKNASMFLGMQRAAFAKAGVRQEGTPFMVLVDTATELETDIQIDFFNLQVIAHQQRTQAGIERSNAEINRFNSVMAQQRRRLAPIAIGLQAAPQLIQSGASLSNSLRAVNQP
jgi:deoxyhypusine synthase